jgi:CheY-like chemotaxis protein
MMRKRLKVLVAEDSEDDAFLLQRALSESGLVFNAHFVTDGQMVLDYLEGAVEFGDREQHPLPSIIITDLKMPRLSGFEALKWLKEQPKHCSTPVLIFSGSEDKGDVGRAYALGANAYFVKPGGPAEMVDLVATLVSYWHRFAKLPESEN